MTRCPSCGSSTTHQSNRNRDEFSCGDCDAVFNSVMERVYFNGDYKKFYGSVASVIVENMTDANVGSSIKEIIEGYKNESPEDVSLLVERLVDIARDLYNDFQMNRRDKYDFGALLEGINRLNEFANIQFPQDTENELTPHSTDTEVPEVDELSDPMSMLSKNDGSIEVGEHRALSDLKTAITSVQSAIDSLESAESQETSASEINQGIDAIPTDDSTSPTFEGMQNGLMDEPVSSDLGSLPVNNVPATHISPAGHEGIQHGEDEQTALSQLKSSLLQLKDAYAKYIQSEEGVHGKPDVSASSDFTDKLSAISGLDSGIDTQTYLEKAKELMEDAQLVDQDFLKQTLEKSKAVDTQEIAENALDSSIKGGIKVGKKIGSTIGGAVVGTVGGLVKGAYDGAVATESGAGKIADQSTHGCDLTKLSRYDRGPLGMQRDNEDGKWVRYDDLLEICGHTPTNTLDETRRLGTSSGENSDQPGDVDLNGPIHTDDEVQGFSPENFFQPEDNVLYENKQHVVIGVDGSRLTIRNVKNGHTIEVLSEDVNYANSEDVDIRGQRFSESNNSLRSAWEKMEKTMNDGNLNAPKRTYDLRTKKLTEGF